MVHIFNEIPLSHKKWNAAFAAMWIDLEGTMLNKSERQILYDITYIWHLKTETNQRL